jgi:hypothetical protein
MLPITRVFTRSLPLRIVLVGAVLAFDAAAQGTSAVAEGLFNQGRTSFDAKNYEDACPKFRESDRLEPATGTKLNLALCEEARGNVATAWALFRTVIERLTPADPRYAIADEHRQALTARVPHVVIRPKSTAPSGTTGTLGDLELVSAMFGAPLPIDPGPRELVVHAPGHDDAKIPFTTVEGQTVAIDMEPGPPTASPSPLPSRRPDALDAAAKRRTWAYVSGGVGLAGVAVGTVFGVLTLTNRSQGHADCPNASACKQSGVDAYDRARTFRTVSDVGWAVAIAGIGAGAVLYLTSRHSPKEMALAVHVEPASAGLSFFHRF